MGVVAISPVLMHNWRIIPLIAMLAAITACDRPAPEPQPRPVSPNNDSELALLMREMFEDSERIKAQMIRGVETLHATSLPQRDFAAIHAAIPTDSTVRGPVFTAFADAYLESVRQLEAADSTSVFRFNRMVDQCMNCHTEFCPGPKKRIRKLYIGQ